MHHTTRPGRSHLLVQVEKILLPRLITRMRERIENLDSNEGLRHHLLEGTVTGLATSLRLMLQLFPAAIRNGNDYLFFPLAKLPSLLKNQVNKINE